MGLESQSGDYKLPAGGLLVVSRFIKMEQLRLEPPAETVMMSGELGWTLPRVEGNRPLHHNIRTIIPQLELGAEMIDWNSEVEF